MKTRLFLIITALLASASCNSFAEDADKNPMDISISDASAPQFIYENDSVDVIPDAAYDDEDELLKIGDEDIFDMDSVEYEDDIYAAYEKAQLSGENLPWDGTTLAEITPIDGVYEVSNGAQLAWIADKVNAGNGGMCNDTIILTDDIDLGGHLWTPIGYDYSKPFAGSFNGNGHKVTNLNFDASNYTHAGLFGCVIGTVSGIQVHTIEEGISTSRRVDPSAFTDIKTGVGIIAGTVEKRLFDFNTKEYTGCIEDCYAYGSLSVSNSFGAKFQVGGIAGANSNALLINNRSNASITIESIGTDADTAAVGGIVGLNTGELHGTKYISDEVSLNENDVDSSSVITIKSSNVLAGTIAGENTGTITGTAASPAFNITKTDTRLSDDYANIGGIVGKNSGNIEDCSVQNYNITVNDINSSAFLNAGGIAGEVSADGIITDCNVYTDINIISPSSSNIGGIAGAVSGINAIITDCVAEGKINTSSDIYVCAGGIAGRSFGIIDSCQPEMNIDINDTVTASGGAVVGVSYNSVNDCISSGNVTITSSSDAGVLYGAGIAGEAYGHILRCTYNGTVTLSGVNAYAGGIAGRAKYDADNSILSDTNTSVVNIEKCSVGKTANIINPYISGGIIGMADNAAVLYCSFNGNISGALGSGGIAGDAFGLKAENCIISGSNNSAISSGIVYQLAGGSNEISKSYITSALLGETKYAITEEISKCLVSDVYLNTDITGCDISDGITAVTNETAKERSTFNAFDFNNVWLMDTAAPILQHTKYSNSVNSVGEITTRNMNFHISLENPQVGQRIYVALYDDTDRFCGTVSTICTETDINETKTRADLQLTYKYDYYNYETWEKADGLPVKARAFTWDEENGMRGLSSVDEQILVYSFD